MTHTVIWGAIGSGVIIAMSLFTDGAISIYTYASIALFIYVAFHEVMTHQIEKRQSEFTDDVTVFLANVKHSYTLTQSIPESILRASEGLNYEVRAHANQMYKILTDANRESIIKEYMSNPNTNRYMKLFLTQCYEASEFGDQVNEDGVSIFAENVETLRTEILKDDLYNKRKSWRYRGHMFIIVIPCFTVGLFKRWGMDFAEGLSSFYATTGHLVIVATFVITIIIYRIFMRMREYYAGQQNSTALPRFKTIHKVAEHLREGDGFISKQIRKVLRTCNHLSLEDLITKMLIAGAGVFLVMLLVMTALHHTKRADIINSFSIDSVNVVATAKQRTALGETASSLLAKYKDDTTITAPEIAREIQKQSKIANTETAKAIAELIVANIEKYHNEFISWKEYLIIILVAVLGSSLPLIELLYTYKAIEESKDNEVNQFQVIIAMEYRFKNATILSILEALENFSVGYKRSLRKCLNNYSTGVENALETLRAEEFDNRKFCEIVDSLIVAANIGIGEAFAEIDNNRAIGMQAHEVTREIEFEKSSNKIDIIALLPMIMVLGGYFIVPFIVSSMSDFMAMYGSLEIVQETMQ